MSADCDFACLYVDSKDAWACLPKPFRDWRAALTAEQLYRMGVKYYLLRDGAIVHPQYSVAKRLDAGLSRVCKEYAAKFGALPEGLLTENLFLTARRDWKARTTPVWLSDLAAQLPAYTSFSFRALYEACLRTATSPASAVAPHKIFTMYGNALITILGVEHHEAWRILLEDIAQIDGISLYD